MAGRPFPALREEKGLMPRAVLCPLPCAWTENGRAQHRRQGGKSFSRTPGRIPPRSGRIPVRQSCPRTGRKIRIAALPRPCSCSLCVRGRTGLRGRTESPPVPASPVLGEGGKGMDHFFRMFRSPLYAGRVATSGLLTGRAAHPCTRGGKRIRCPDRAHLSALQSRRPSRTVPQAAAGVPPPAPENGPAVRRRPPDRRRFPEGSPPADESSPRCRPTAGTARGVPHGDPYRYSGSQLPCAAIRSSTIRTMVSISSSLPVCGSSMAA